MGGKKNTAIQDFSLFASNAAKYSAQLGQASLACTCGIFALAAMAIWGATLDAIIATGIIIVVLVIVFLTYDIICAILQRRNAQSDLDAAEQKGARMKQRYRSRATKGRKAPQARVARNSPLLSVDEVDTVQGDTSSHLARTSDPRRSK